MVKQIQAILEDFEKMKTQLDSIANTLKQRPINGVLQGEVLKAILHTQIGLLEGVVAIQKHGVKNE